MRRFTIGAGEPEGFPAVMSNMTVYHAKDGWTIAGDLEGFGRITYDALDFNDLVLAFAAMGALGKWVAQLKNGQPIEALDIEDHRQGWRLICEQTGLHE